MSAFGHRQRPPTGVLLAAIAICAAATLPYLSTLDDYFIRDDFGVVQLFARKPAFYFPLWFISAWTDRIWGDVADEIRPFPALSYQLTALGGAASPFAHHFFNVALHAANGVLVLIVARSIAGIDLPAAAFAALAFVLLPAQAEGVAWITGRVDTMPALFYIAAFLAYARWRSTGSTHAGPYVLSLALFFAALFTKQTTITMPATLMAYDVMLENRAARARWRWIRPYVPFIVLTTGYLVLRFILFGEVARERQLSTEGLSYSAYYLKRHLSHVVIGNPTAASLVAAVVAFVVLLWVWLLTRTRSPDEASHLRAALLYFGPVWWIIGVAPIAVAGYESPRHVYLASAGWAIVLGLAFHAAWTASAGARWRRLTLVAGMLVLGFYSMRLQEVVRDWNTIAAVSRQVMRDVRNEALSAPPGTLVIVGAPVRSWEWAVPFSVRPPFTRVDLTERVVIVTPWLLHCCRAQWFEETRRRLRSWVANHGDAPIVVLRWHPESGALARVTDREYPALRSVTKALVGLETLQALDATILKMVNQLTEDRESKKYEVRSTK